MIREPYKRWAKNVDANLPVGKTCKDCNMFRRCKKFVGQLENDERCYFDISKFNNEETK